MNKENLKLKLDQMSLDIEFLLISVVQGVALGALATNSSDPLSLLKFEYWPYIASGFIFVLIFWSQAIIHALSFIDWPLDLSHNFLYFLASFIEVLAFSHVTNPLVWFAYLSVFLFVAGVLYLVDLRLILKHKKDFEDSEPRKKLYKHILGEQVNELKTLVPLGIVFNISAFLLIYFYPDLMIGQGYHLIPVMIQVVFGVLVLFVSVKSFKKRSRLISECI